MQNRFYLIPNNGRKSFYGKAVVEIDAAGNQTLYSYNTKILTRTIAGDYIRHWDGWTATTGRHIAAFCGMNKARFESLETGDERS